MNPLEIHFQDKHGEKWTCVDLMAHNIFSNSTSSKIKFASTLNMHGDRIKTLDKMNVHA